VVVDSGQQRRHRRGYLRHWHAQRQSRPGADLQPDSRPGRLYRHAAFTWAAQIQYVPPTMGVPGVAGTNGDPPYFGAPAFYLTDLGVAGDGAGEAYQIMPTAMAGTAGTVAVVESTYEVAQGVVNRGGL